MSEQEEVQAKSPYDLVVNTLRSHPSAQLLTEEQLQSVAQAAIVEKKINDPLWLQEKIKQVEDQAQNIPGSKIPKMKVNRPAEIRSQEDLEDVIEAHKLWLADVLHPSRGVTSARANLTGCKLSGLDLSEADLRGAKLSQADLSHCQLSGAQLSTCDLSDANFTGASMEAVKLKRCKLNGTNFTDANLRRADLRRSEGEGTIWLNTCLDDAILE